MGAKQLVSGHEARQRLRRRADPLAEAVRVTPGPRRRSVILDPDLGRPQTAGAPDDEPAGQGPGQPAVSY